MPIIVRPAGDTDLANATITEEASLPQVISGLVPNDYEVGRVEWSTPVTVTAAVATFTGIVADFPEGQSNIVGTNNIDGVLPISQQGQFDRVELVNTAWIGDNNLPLTVVHQVVETGQTVDGVVGKVPEFGSPNGISHVHGVALEIADTTGSGLVPSASRLVVYKNGNSGTPQTNWAPDGGGFNTSDFLLRNHLPNLIASEPVRVWGFTYGQGEAEAQAVADDTEAAQGVTAPDVIIPAGENDIRLTEWAANQVSTRRAKREYFDVPSLPYVFLGVVLPDRTTEAYDDNAERFREILTTQYRNMARWAVRLNEAGDAITVTDLGVNLRSISYDTVTDTFTETVTGTVSPYKDDQTYWIDARGYASPDSLHHGPNAQVQIGKAKALLMEHIYGAGGTPPVTHEITEVKPVFYEPVTATTIGDTSLAFSFTPSEAVTCYVSAYAAGSPVPTSAEVVAGTGAVASVNVPGLRRQQATGNIGGLLAETAYDIYSVLVFGGITGKVTGPLEATTLATIASPISVVGGDTAQLEPFATEGDTQNIALPTMAENDISMVYIAADTGIDQNVANQGMATAGYTQLFNIDTGNPGAYIGWKRQGATPDTVASVFLRDKRQSVAVQVYRGVDTVTAFDAPLVINVGNGPNPDPESLTTVTENAYRIVGAFFDDDDAQTVTAPSGYGDLLFTGTSLATTPGAQGATIMVASKAAGPAGAENPQPFTTDSDDAWQAFHIALRPA